jgi:hypothetical protein
VALPELQAKAVTASNRASRSTEPRLTGVGRCMTE